MVLNALTKFRHTQKTLFYILGLIKYDNRKKEWKSYPMSKQVIGKAFVLLAAIAMIINVLFFKSTESYDFVRKTTFAICMLGVILIPTYSKVKRN